MEETRREVTALLNKASAGDADALRDLVPLVFDELHKIAAHYMRRERAGHTLQPTLLVNEAYLRLVGRAGIEWKGRAHFFGLAAHAMRQILVDHARAARARKRHGGFTRVTLDDAQVAAKERDIDLVALDDALDLLERRDPAAARLVELRFFSGLSIPETAVVLGTSKASVEREWAHARAWLFHQLTREVEV